MSTIELHTDRVHGAIDALLAAATALQAAGQRFEAFDAANEAVVLADSVNYSNPVTALNAIIEATA